MSLQFEMEEAPITVKLPGDTQAIRLPMMVQQSTERNGDSPRILSNPNYVDVTFESLIKLLLRIKQFYAKIQDTIKLLGLIIKQRPIFAEEGKLFRSLAGDCRLSKDDEGALVRGLNLL